MRSIFQGTISSLCGRTEENSECLSIERNQAEVKNKYL